MRCLRDWGHVRAARLEFGDAMQIDGKIEGGYVIICQDEHVFVVERLGLYVECPSCGRRKIGADLAMDYVLGGSNSLEDRVPQSAALAK
jgi:hypothetical protein